MSTLHSLSADGGVVAAMDLVIIKVRLTCFRSMYTYQAGEDPCNCIYSVR